jgi:uracil-DNA glycosylase
MQVKIAPSWKMLLEEEFQKPYFQQLADFVKQEVREGKSIFPPGKLIFSAFDHCAPEAVKVVILGQDPYHGDGQANGLAFSVNDGVPFPPSLLNIFKEISSDLGKPMPASGNLARWAEQGVMLLNATLTVRRGEAGSHQNKGWEAFTDAAIRQLAERYEGIAFLLWGSYARKKGAFIDRRRHLVLESAHPSPLSAHRGFLGNRHFSQANAYLQAQGKSPIDW